MKSIILFKWASLKNTHKRNKNNTIVIVHVNLFMVSGTDITPRHTVFVVDLLPLCYLIAN